MTLRLALQRGRALLARAGRDETGATAVEFALVSPMYLAVLIAIFQIFVIWYAKTELQIATEYGARLVFTANSPPTQAAFKAAICGQLPIIMGGNSCRRLFVNLTDNASFATVSTQAPKVHYGPKGNPTNTPSYNTGAPGDIMVLQAIYPLPVVGSSMFNFGGSNGQLPVISTLVFQNEPAK